MEIRTGWAIGALLVAASLLWAGPDGRPTREVLDELRKEMRETKARYRVLSARHEAQLRILRRALRMRHEATTDWAVQITRTMNSADLQRDAIRLLAKEAPHAESVILFHRECMESDHPLRPIAREFLLGWAVRKAEGPWLLLLFRKGNTEDRFLALQALGRIGAPESVPYAWKLLRDPKWTPHPAGTVHCGTLAAAVRRFEGDEAARFLLLLQRDPRFRPTDRAAIRQATRVWRYADLTRYINIKELAHPDALRREMMARFMGQAGFEAARAPLIGLARDPQERVHVRAAAAEALGGLRLARADLAAELKGLLEDPEAKVRSAAVRALATLRVRESVGVLLPTLKTSLGTEVRAALADAERLPPETDWAEWLASDRCPLPNGT
jgi:hypothetical protein